MENANNENAVNYDIEKNTSISEYRQPCFTNTPIEETVIKAAQKGDKKSFEALFMGTYRYVFAAVRKYLKNDQDVYDAIQDTYVRVYKGISRLESVSSFYPWLHRICENCAKDVLRYSNSEVVISYNEDIEKIPIRDKSEETDISADIGDALKQLPKEQAELLVMVYYDKMRVTEIAHFKALPVTTVHNRLKAAKKSLKELLKVRGIDKPIYSGEFVSMVSTALRDAIGTHLLSMAVAEEILHNVVSSKNKKEASVVSVFARKMRNNAVKKIAAILLLACVSITMISFFVVGIFVNNFYKNGGSGNVSDKTAAKEPTSSENGSSSVPSSTVSDSKQEGASQGSTSINSNSSQFDFYLSVMEEPVELLGSFTSTEVFGTHVDNEELDIAVTDGKVYAVVKGNLVSLVSGNSTADLLIENFDELYGKDGKYLNVFDGKVYWVNKNNEDRFVLNRCNIDGTGHYSVVFDDSTLGTRPEYIFLNKFIVAKDGIYFCMGVCNDYDDKYPLLYRVDHDFNIEKRLESISDYTLIKDKIYYISGDGNCGHPFQMDRATFKNRVDITADWIAYDNIYSVGEYIVLDSHSPYADPANSRSTDLIVMDTVSGKIVRAIYGKSDYVIDIKDVSDFGGGTVLLQYNDKAMTMNVKTGEMKVVTNHNGAVLGNYKYFIESDSFYIGNIDGNSRTKVY